MNAMRLLEIRLVCNKFCTLNSIKMAKNGKLSTKKIVAPERVRTNDLKILRVFYFRSKIFVNKISGITVTCALV